MRNRNLSGGSKFRDLATITGLGWVFFSVIFWVAGVATLDVRQLLAGGGLFALGALALLLSRN